jgi:hypothetical protein
MTTIAYSPVNIQTSAQSEPSIPVWFEEITVMAQYLQRQGVLAAIEEQVRFARRRFGHYEVIDFVGVLFGYAISGERTQDRLLRTTPALGKRVHGALWARPLAGPFDAQSLSRLAGPDRG